MGFTKNVRWFEKHQDELFMQYQNKTGYIVIEDCNIVAYKRARKFNSNEQLKFATKFFDKYPEKSEFDYIDKHGLFVHWLCDSKHNPEKRVLNNRFTTEEEILGSKLLEYLARAKANAGYICYNHDILVIDTHEPFEEEDFDKLMYYLDEHYSEV